MYHCHMGLKEALDELHPDIKIATLEASKALADAGVRHTVIGGIAVGAYGYLRATRDVDFLIGDEAFESSGLIVSFRPGLPIMVGGIPVDYIPVEEDEDFLEDEFDNEVVSLPALIYLKLKAGRRKDIHDVRELIESGIDEDEVLDYLIEVDDELAAKFRKILDTFAD